MGRLLKYSTVLALAVMIGGYIVFGPPSDEDIIPGPAQQRDRRPMSSLRNR